MMRKFTLILMALFPILLMAQPANNNCANATNLTAGAPLVCGQTTNAATTESGEYCAGSGGGITPKTVWYRFTATATTMVLNVLRTNDINCFGRLSVFGPNPTCQPTAGNAILDCVLMNGDPGFYPELTGLTVGASYLVQYNGQGCGGANDNYHDFCIGVYEKAINSTVNTPTIINECGVVFNGTTQGGYSPSGTDVGFRNLDGNAGTTCPACGAQPGADVPFVVNNDSWFNFCSASGGTWQVNFTVGSCVFSGINSGLQMAVFTGSPSALTWHSQAPNPTASGGTWTSPTITLAAGQCAYLMVDGFAGDACSYNYTLTNLSGGCILLPIRYISFTGQKLEYANLLAWATEGEGNSTYFGVERSADGVNFTEVGRVNSLANSSQKAEYEFWDDQPLGGVNYYRLRQTFADGSFSYSQYILVDRSAVDQFAVVASFPNPADDQFSLDISAENPGEVVMEIFGLNGKQVQMNAMILSEGMNHRDVDIASLPKGMYFVTLRHSLTGKTTQLPLAVY